MLLLSSSALLYVYMCPGRGVFLQMNGNVPRAGIEPTPTYYSGASVLTIDLSSFTDAVIFPTLTYTCGISPGEVSTPHYICRFTTFWYMCMWMQVCLYLYRLVACWNFTYWQHQEGSYQDRYQLVTVRTHDDYIVLPHWEMKPPAP